MSLKGQLTKYQNNKLKAGEWLNPYFMCFFKKIIPEWSWG